MFSIQRFFISLSSRFLFSLSHLINLWALWHNLSFRKWLEVLLSLALTYHPCFHFLQFSILSLMSWCTNLCQTDPIARDDPVCDGHIFEWWRLSSRVEYCSLWFSPKGSGRYLPLTDEDKQTNRVTEWKCLLLLG